MRREVLWKLKRNIGGVVLLLGERYNRRATSVGDRVRIDESSSFAGRYIQVSGCGGQQKKRERAATVGRQWELSAKNMCCNWLSKKTFRAVAQ